MNILIIGSEGFIGTNLVKYFSGKGYSVASADILLKEALGYTSINAEAPDFASLFAGKSFDYCINASGAANVQFSFSNPAIDYTLNVSNVYHILDAIRKHGKTCRFINFSSAAVYGNPDSLPISEKAKTHPLSPYGWHKLYSEQVCSEFAGCFGLQTLSLRIFSVYGEGLQKQLFWDVYRKIKASTNRSVELFGTGQESRDFIYIHDLTRAIDTVMQKASFTGEVINVASGVELTISHCLQIFSQYLEPGLRIHFNGKIKEGDPLNWRADISLLKTMGFETEFSLSQGLKKTSDWLKHL